VASRSQELLFVPLGGVGEIGMNLALYGVGEPGDPSWLMVDCGITFAEGASLPGVDVIMPDIRFITEDRRSLKGLVLTHGHEDHLGAVIDLWPRLRCPIYATPFTAGLLKAKAAEERGAPDLPIKIVPVGGRVVIGRFDVEFLPVAHSIPESHSLAIRTAAGKVLHTGDWKLDPTPPLGDVTDLERFAAFGREGVDAIVADSTNAVRDGRSPSEAEVAATLTALLKDAPARVAVTLFASNIGRVHSIASAARDAGRDVVILGRALDRNVTVAREVGYLSDFPPFLGMDAYGYLPRDKVCAIMTGSQGEERSALARVARGDHPHVALSKGDRVIFSSRVIPGNERPVLTMLNGLVRQGVEVITDRTHLVHVSGHPRTDEMKELYEAVRPRALLPVHGEPIHLDTHEKLGKAWGIPEVVGASNGAVVRLAPGPAEIVDWVPSGRLLKDGKILLVEDETDTVQQRRRLAFAGIVSIALALDTRGQISGEIDVQHAGLPELGLSGDSMRAVISEMVFDVVESLPKQRRKDRKLVEEAVVRAVRAAVDEEWGKKPMCHVAVMAV
jgi:ribonuclease J